MNKNTIEPKRHNQNLITNDINSNNLYILTKLESYSLLEYEINLLVRKISWSKKRKIID